MIEPTFKMIFTVSNKEKVQQAVTNNLRTLGVKPRLKRNIIKTSEKDSVRNDKFKKVFNILLSQQPTDPVKLSTGTILHVPTFVRQAVQYLDNHLNQEGLFRKAGSNTRLKELVSRLDNGIELDDKSQPIDVANCLKKYFRDLPEPLIPYCYHDLFVRCGMLKIGKIDAILQACLLLPSQYLSTLAFVMDFLKKVSLHEKMNKMGIDNLAKVVGPNIMPLRETTMAAVQTRLDAHLTIIKILIENARNIGVVPKFILDTLSIDSNGSIENELDHSDSSFKQKKKKHRSGSLTRMFNGLKKIVGKNGSPECGMINRRSVDSQSSLVSPIKPNKKRKIIDTISHPHHHQQQQQQQLIQLKKKRESYQGTSRVLFSSPVSDDPNPTQQRQQQLKQEKHKKLGINLDRFVLKNRQKLIDNERSSPTIERRWSMATGTSKNIKKRNIKKTSASSLLETKIYNKNNEFTMRPLNEDYNKMFTESEINLSDDTFDDCHNNLSILSKKNYNRRSINYNNLQQQQSSNKRLSVSSPSLITPTAPVSPSILSSSTTKFHEEDTDYVRIPKKEYEEIKNRVSAIETRIHEEFETIDDNNLYNIDLPSQVQIKYEKTLDKSNIETITPADQLAKRLSRDLKIRKSIENKIIRSPSARKIGVIRRRSQDKLQLSNRRKLNRSSSWHISDKSKAHDNNTIKHINSNNTNNDCLYLNNETNAKLDYVHKKLCTLINHTDEHTKSPTINYSSINNNIKNTIININTNNNNIKRSSSFHGNETIDNNKKIIFNNQMKNIKNTNSHRLILPINNNDNNNNNINEDNTIIWNNASNYFDNNNNSNKQSIVKENNSPAVVVVSQTGRASIAKLRTQNAGMVLAKARLFDDNDNNKLADNNTAKIERQKNNNLRDVKVVISSPTINSSSSLSSRRRKSKSPKNVDLKYKLSPIKLNSQLSMIDQENSRRENLLSVAPIGELSLFHDVDTSLIKTPHIKKQLAIKTPKSAKSVVRRVPIDTRRTPLKAVAPPFVGTPKRQSPRNAFRSKIVARNII